MDADRSLRESFYSNKRNSYSFISLNNGHVREAIERSPDNGATLTFSRMNLSDVGARAAEELATIKRDTLEDESTVKRIALGNNHLTTLPTEFALLSNLRYLNLKHNNFLVFPDVLTLMPSLDTLDISYNKIKRLPSQPGQLVQLRVFSLSRNRLARLPSYLSHFYNLGVLQVDRNPIEWPPSSVLEPINNLNSSQSMKEWVQSLQKWLELGAFREHSIGHNEQHDLDSNTHPWQNNAGNPPHIRSFSVDSSLSVSSIAESLQAMDVKNTTERPPPLHLGILKSYSAEASPTRSFESYLPSPAGSDTSSHDGAPINPFRVDYYEPRLHTRNESYSGDFRNSNRVELRGKKSMPDLRTAKLNFEELSSNFAEGEFSADTLGKDQNNNESSTPFDPSQQQDSHSYVGSDSIPSRSVATGVRNGTSVTLERDAYFRELSTTPNGVPLPKATLCLIDSARSILFAMSQAYETLEQYAANTANDHLSSILKKVLDPASANIMHFINALVLFDVTSRRAAPSPGVCRGVVENCKNTVAVFGKVVAVLSLQLKVISTGNDVRHSRWILLALNAATVEISCAWQAIIPHMDSIKTLLRPKASSTHLNATILDFDAVKGAAGQSSSVLRPHFTGLNSADVSATAGRVRTARRHAGSFSSKDVEIGKKLPSYEDIPGTFRGVVSGLATHTPTLRPLKRRAAASLSATSVIISSPPPNGSIPVASFSSSFTLPEESRTTHSRQESQGSLQTSSSSSSPSAPSKASFLDLSLNSKAQVDKEALQAVQAAVDIAPEVWDMIEDALSGVVEATGTVRETLEIARAVTAGLSGIIQSMQSVDSAPTDRKSLREDAHVFLKTVVQMSNIIKMYGTPHTVSPTLRTKMVKLTNSTEEFAILLHVSSLSPANPRSYSPMLSSLSPDENRLGSSLSRSRSAQPSATFKLPAQSRDGSRSALPTQSCLTPVVRGPRGKETYNDLGDPG